MGFLRHHDQLSFQDEQVLFWSSGNGPTQAVLGLTEQDVISHLKALYLLSDRVLAAASFYFESALTRAATRTCRDFFEGGNVIYFVGEGVSDFEDHGERKIEKSPKNLLCYKNVGLVSAQAKELNGLGNIFKRPADSISDKMVEMWAADVFSSEPGSVGAYLARSINNTEDRAALQAKLVEVARARDADFVWEYLGPRLKALGIREEAARQMRTRLSELYLRSTITLLAPESDQTDRHGLQAIPGKRGEPQRFLVCLESLQLTDAFQRLRVQDTIRLRESMPFRLFKEFYLELIKEIGTDPEMRRWVPFYRMAEGKFARSSDPRERVLKSFQEYVRSIEPGTTTRIRPLEILLKAFEFCGSPVITSFVEEVRSITAEKPPSIDASASHRENVVPTIIIPPAARRRGIPLDEASMLVRQWLAAKAKDNPATITRDAVAAGTGVSAGQVSNTPAWKAFRERRDSEKKQSAREVSLTDKMQAVIPVDGERPDELAALIEEQGKDEAEQERMHRHGPS